MPDHPDRTPARPGRLLCALALACAVMSFVVFCERGLAAWRAAAVAPGVAVTSGYEEESMLALWRVLAGQPVYADPHHLPFAAAYFNWLFYSGYGLWLKFVFPTPAPYAELVGHGRLLTALGALAGAFVLYRLLRRAAVGRPVAAGWSAFVFGGPLVGWWAHTLRPDVWALACETAAVAVLLAGWRRRPLAAALGSALLFYAAWSFKQTYLPGLAAGGAFLLFRRQPRAAGVLLVVSALLWGLTFAGLGSAYRANYLATTVTNKFILPAGWGNLRDFLLKTAPLWLLVPATGPGRTDPRRPPLADDLRLLGWTGLGLSLPLCFAASCKIGAASNYYFTPLLMLALLAATAVRTAFPAALAFAAATAMQLAVATGRIDLTPQTRALSFLWSRWRQEAEPRYASLHSLNLPWLNPHSPPLVLAFNYPLERETGRPFEAGGVGGLIAAGSLRTLLLPADTTDRYDGGSLDRYVRGESVPPYAIFRRQPASP